MFLQTHLLASMNLLEKTILHRFTLMIVRKPLSLPANFGRSFLLQPRTFTEKKNASGLSSARVKWMS